MKHDAGCGSTHPGTTLLSQWAAGQFGTFHILLYQRLLLRQLLGSERTVATGGTTEPVDNSPWPPCAGGRNSGQELGATRRSLASRSACL